MSTAGSSYGSFASRTREGLEQSRPALSRRGATSAGYVGTGAVLVLLPRDRDQFLTRDRDRDQNWGCSEENRGKTHILSSSHRPSAVG